MSSLLLIKSCWTMHYKLLSWSHHFRKFYGRHNDLLDHYRISVSQMTPDMTFGLRLLITLFLSLKPTANHIPILSTNHPWVNSKSSFRFGDGRLLVRHLEVAIEKQHYSEVRLVGMYQNKISCPPNSAEPIRFEMNNSWLRGFHCHVTNGRWVWSVIGNQRLPLWYFQTFLGIQCI